MLLLFRTVQPLGAEVLCSGLYTDLNISILEQHMKRVDKFDCGLPERVEGRPDGSKDSKNVLPSCRTCGSCLRTKVGGRAALCRGNESEDCVEGVSERAVES